MDDHRSLTNLRRYWEAVAGGRPAAPGDLDPELAALVQRLHATPDVPPPDSTFASNLREHLMHATTAPLAPAILPPPNGRAPGSFAPGLFPPRPAPTRRWPAAQIAIVLLLLAAMAATYLITVRPSSAPTFTPAMSTPAPQGLMDDWPMFRGNPAHNSANAGPGPAGTPVEVWTYHASGPVSRSPAVAEGVVYLQSGDGLVTALDAATGAVRWQNADTNVGENTPTVAGDLLYLTNLDGQLIALDRATGTERWRFAQTISAESLPTVVDGVVYVGSEDGTLFAVDAVTGEERWQVPATGGIFRSISVSGDVIYFGTTNGHVEARNLADGSPIWQTSGPDPGQTIGAPAVAGGMVYASISPGFSALDAATGEVIWSAEGTNSNAVSGGLLVNAREDGSVQAFDALTGEELWSFTTGARVQAAPAIIGDTVYVASFDQSVYALDAATGQERWSFDLDGVAAYGPSVAEGMLYIGTDSGTLYAIGGSGMEQLAAPDPDVRDATPVSDTMATPNAATAAPVTILAPSVITQPTLVHHWTRSKRSGDVSGNVGGAAIDPFSRIWVCNDNDGSLDIFDRDGNKLNHIAGGKGSEPGQWDWQIGTPNVDANWLGCSFAFAPDGTAYVTDAGNERVQVLSPDGSLKTTWSTADPEKPELQGPVAISRLQNGEFLITDWGVRNVIRRFSADGQFLEMFEPAEGVVETFWDPIATLVDGEGNIWVTELAVHRVVKLTPNGQLLLAIGGPNPGSRPGTFREPTGMAVDDRGNIYVTDDDNRRLQVFAPDGAFLAEFTGAETGIPRFGGDHGGVGIIAYGGGTYFFVADYTSDTFADGDERLMKFQILLPADAPAATASPVATPG